jgi:phage gp46-like protein
MSDFIVAGGSATIEHDTLPPDLVREIEARAGVDALGELHARRRQLLVNLAPLKALHGHNGIWDDKRKAYLECSKVNARMTLTANAQKTTEAAVEAQAYADPEYLKFIDDGIAARIEYITQQNELDEITERIRSREIELLAYNGELKLAR